MTITKKRSVKRYKKKSTVNKYLQDNTGIILETLLSLAVNTEDDLIKMQAIKLWLTKTVDDKRSNNSGNSSTTNVVVLPSIKKDEKATIELPPILELDSSSDE